VFLHVGHVKLLVRNVVAPFSQDAPLVGFEPGVALCEADVVNFLILVVIEQCTEMMWRADALGKRNDMRCDDMRPFYCSKEKDPNIPVGE